MWKLSPAALMAISLFSISASSLPQAGVTTVTIMRTVTVVPIPTTTAAGVSSGFTSVAVNASGIASPATTSSGRFANSTASSYNHTNANATINVPLFTLNISASVPVPTVFPTANISDTTSKKPSGFHTSRVHSSTVKSTPRVSTKSSAKPSSTSSTALPTSTGHIKTPFLRGVNLGGWLVLESWMNSDMFSGDFADAVDQYTFDSISGAEDALVDHWSTFFNESDIQTLANTGINALRIPIGFWAYNNTGTPYISGADAYLEKATGWARNAGMKVWVDCHGSPGSQNGFDNSGHAGSADWQRGDNQESSIDVLKTMARKYGSQAYADVIVGLELVNEPISYGNNDFSVTQAWAKQAYKAVRAEAENKDLVIVMHDAFEGPLAWTNVAQQLFANASEDAPKTFGIDNHAYQLFTAAENTETQAQHIAEACGWAANLRAANAVMPTYVGEWSATTNICVDADGRTSAGSSCATAGCQCTSANFEDWNDALVMESRKFVEAQMDVFERSTSGYFMWAAKAPGGWGFLNGIAQGTIPNPVTSRKYPAQCSKSGVHL